MKRIIFFLGCVLINSPVFATSLEEELIYAYKNNPELKSYREYLKAKDEGVAAAISGIRPEITASSQASQLVGVNSNQDEDSAAYKDRFAKTNSVTLTQPLFTGFRTAAELKAARNTVLGTRAGLKDKEQAILLDAAMAYFDVGRDIAVLELEQNNEKVLSSHHDAAKSRLKVGELTITDVSQSEARYEQAKSATIKAKGDLMVSKAAYEKVIGRSPSGIETLNSKIVSMVPDNFSRVLDESLKNSPLLKSAEYNYKAAKGNIGVARSSLLPTVDIVTSYDDARDVNAKGLDTSGGTIGAVLKIPLYDKGLARSKLRAAKYEAGQSRIDIDVTKEAIKEFAKQAWENYMTTKASLKSIESQIKAAKLALDGVKKESQLGTRTLLDVLDSEQEYLDARVSLIKAKRDEAVALFQVLNSMGKLMISELKLPTEIYNPVKHYQDTKWKWLDTSID